MVRQRVAAKAGSAAPLAPGQSMSELESMLALAQVSDDGVKADAKCLTCVRSTDQKYCYDTHTGAGTCCAMSDLDSEGCNQQENPRIVCSTDKLIARSSAYEVCPHDPD